MKNYTKSLLRGALGAAFLFTTVFAQGKSAVFTILSFNDVYEIVPDSLGRGGFAEMEALLQEEKKTAKHHITTLNGDFLSPCTLSVFDKGAHRIELFNKMGIDLVVLGNHEFDFGPEVALQRIKESHFPWLAANAIGLDGKYFTGKTQKIIVDVEGIKVGIFGLITTATPDLSSTENKVCFPPLVYTANKMIKELKEEGADVIVALTHLTMSEDMRLAEEVPEINVILGGHDHDPMTFYDDKTFIHKSGQNAYYLVRLDLILEKNEETGVTRALPSWNMILNKGVERDPEIGVIVDGLQAHLESLTNEPLGRIGVACDSLYSNVRARETKIGNLVADALYHSLDADVALISGGLIRGNKFYNAGDLLTFRDLLDEFPFANLSVLVEMTGENIIAALENGVSLIGRKAGRFPQVAGMSFTCKEAAPVGERISNVLVGGAPIDLNKVYKVATVDYLFNGGDGYGMLKEGKVLISPLDKIGLVDTLANYIKAAPEIVMELEGRIVVEKASQNLDHQHGNPKSLVK
jgi:5'-nucleotidase / UDP-sugar diphosphatase